MKVLSNMAACFTVLSVTLAAPASPTATPAAANSTLIACQATCPQVACVDLWPQSCYCQNNLTLECWYECGGPQPSLELCPPQTSTTTLLTVPSTADVPSASATTNTIADTVIPVPTTSTSSISTSSLVDTTLFPLMPTSTSNSESTSSSYGTAISPVPCSLVMQPCKEGYTCVVPENAPCRWLVLGQCDELGTCQPTQGNQY